MRPYATTRVKKISHKQKVRLDALAEVRKQWWKESQESGQPLECGICHGPITRFDDLDSDHIEPGGFGGGRDDSPENLQPAHRLCNLDKGSQRNFTRGKKTVPRKPARLMNKTEMDSYLTALVCFCGGEKGKERPCCLTCHPELSGWAKLELSRTDLSAKLYAELLKEVETQIFKRVAVPTKGGDPCAPSGEVLPAEIGATTEAMEQDLPKNKLMGGDRLIPGPRLEESA